MADYFARAYVKMDDTEGGKLKTCNVTIVKAEIGSKAYFKRYGQDSLKLKGYQPCELIMAITANGLEECVISFPEDQDITGMFADFNVRKAHRLEGKKTTGLKQFSTFVGIRT